MYSHITALVHLGAFRNGYDDTVSCDNADTPVYLTSNSHKVCATIEIELLWEKVIQTFTQLRVSSTANCVFTMILSGDMLKQIVFRVPNN